MKAILAYIRKKLLTNILVAIFTLCGGFALQQFALNKARPVLMKQVIQTDLAGLSSDIKQQITIVPITYSLQNNSRTSAQDVTVFVKSDTLLTVNDLKFTQDSEDHQLTVIDGHEFKVNVPTIRPGGFLGFQLLSSASNKFTFTERSQNALFETPQGLGVDAAQEKTTQLEWGIAAFAVFIWVPVLASLIYIFVKVGKSWHDIETTAIQSQFRKRLIILIVSLYIYTDIILASFGPVGLWLPLPRISFEELIYAFIFYLLVTRYKLIEDWLKAVIEEQKADKSNNSHSDQQTSSVPSGPPSTTKSSH